MALKTLGPRIVVLDARGHLESGYLDYICFSMTPTRCDGPDTLEERRPLLRRRIRSMSTRAGTTPQGSARPGRWAPPSRQLRRSAAGCTRRIRARRTRHGPTALFAACVRAGLRRVVHLSAIGMDREQPTEFSKTKAAGDEALAGPISTG
jgi:hypothetical protein